MIVVENIDGYKLAIIDGSGNIEYFGDNNEYRFHIEALKDYFYTYYFDLANKVDADDMKNNEEIIIYLNRLGKVIFLNSKGYALCYVPKEINVSQKEVLEKLLLEMKDKVIYIEYNLNEKDGKILSENRSNYNMDDSIDLFDENVKIRKVGKSV